MCIRGPFTNNKYIHEYLLHCTGKYKDDDDNDVLDILHDMVYW